MWYLLALSLLILQFNKKIATVILVVTTVIAGYTHTLDGRALSFLVLIAITAVVYRKFSSKSKVFSITLEIFVLLASVGLMLHVIPGFHNLRILDNVRVGPESAPFSMYYNFDKAIIPFVLIICIKSLFATDARQHTSHWYWLILVAAVPALLIIALLLGKLKFEFHHPEWLFQFVLANIFFVSLAEEALFRGYLQQRLSSVISPVPALIISSLLFGIMHYVGGSMIIIFSSLAGLIYGIAWMLSGRLWVAVFFHFGLNLCHLLFFTYPVFHQLP
ncbi:CPBP family intramembrane metalloprotease [Salmonella enterica]|uniref:CPBP family intramembrane metalloprotease n=5 Tax=Salmonella enterica TaxID=28901 RepID=A0A3V2RCN9_SALET|nr:CPBP family intramembrane glutamic endopeptidase [Salmonella enterica]EAA3462960.1 CPBP family intramembrane metalloprotease [Salmonella enterica subsp. enterica serovar Miami]EAA4490755.1 CPBP family intramembrane metalloprotease [Salmonella enterica subsp. enterica]EAA6277956.1 CPBP family intramembrane metalloprotease [Salmonella enterica subsp. enterica serovar Telhashomer]EBM1014686.1 CPBP family intramembrane metalloprotease [Salmonella enterica subsp. enterica serovar Paratyphi B]EBQ